MGLATLLLVLKLAFMPLLRFGTYDAPPMTQLNKRCRPLRLIHGKLSMRCAQSAREAAAVAEEDRRECVRDMHAALDAEIATCACVLGQAAVDRAAAEERCARGHALHAPSAPDAAIPTVACEAMAAS